MNAGKEETKQRISLVCRQKNTACFKVELRLRSLLPGKKISLFVIKIKKKIKKHDCILVVAKSQCEDYKGAGSGFSHSILSCLSVLCTSLLPQIIFSYLLWIFCKLLFFLCQAFLGRKYLCTSPNSNKQNNKALDIGYPEGYYKVLVYWSEWLFFRNLWRKMCYFRQLQW